MQVAHIISVGGVFYKISERGIGVESYMITHGPKERVLSIILALDFHFLVWFFDRSIDQGFGLIHDL